MDLAELYGQLTEFVTQYWRDGLTILVLWIGIYQCYRYFRATRGARILTGLLAIWIGITLLSEIFDLVVIGWLVKSVSVFLAVALVVIFQPELRRALAELGSHRLFSSFSEGRRTIVEPLCEVIATLSHKRFGALIVLQRGIELGPILETGVHLDCQFSKEIILTIFHPNTALHDGGMILRLRDERILGAACVFPLSQRELADRSVGLRHRAAIGVTEESDAIALVVSEETGNVSIAQEGKLERLQKPEELRERLQELLFGGTEEDDHEESASHSLES